MPRHADDMPRRRFGRTEISMPLLSTGGMRYQDGWQDKPLSEVAPASQKNLAAILQRSLELGINHIETARGYGVSERQLGAFLPALPRQQLIVQTKIHPEADPARFVKHFEESLSRLRLDYVDLLGLHGLNDEQLLERALRPGGCLAAARALQRAGKVRHVGFSTHARSDLILEAIRHEADGGFDYVNLHWYFIMQRNWPALVEATRRDMGVFIISPSDKGGKLYAPPPKLCALTQPLHPLVFNDVFCLARPEVHTLSIGVERPSDFDQHVAALTHLTQHEQLLPPILARLGQAMHDATGFHHPDDSLLGIPDWTACPGQLNLQVMVWLRMLALGWGLHDYAKMRFNLLGNGGHWFPGADPMQVLELSATTLQAATAASAFSQKIPQWLHEAVQLLSGAPVKRISQS